jgi:hypothetical protein
VESYYELDELGEPRPQQDVEAWARWYAQADRAVARNNVAPDITVLTTFVGVAEAHASEPPRLFQSRVFGGVLDGEEVTYADRVAAIAGHNDLVMWCQAGNEKDYGVDEQALM